MPFSVDTVDRVPRFVEREHVPVAIVVVPRIVVIDLRDGSRLEGRFQILLVPVHNDIEAVGIQ